MLTPKNRFFPASPLQVFAVEAESMQLCWGRLPQSQIHVCARANVSSDEPSTRAEPAVVEASIQHPGGPGSLELSGLEPATRYDLRVSVANDGITNEPTLLSATTLNPPPGKKLCKFATVSDLHIGARRFGALKTMRDFEPEQKPFAFRCARSAIADAVSWGAEYLIIKGDALHAQSIENLRVLGKLIDDFPNLPMMLLPGNHDVDGRGDLAGLPPVGKRKLDWVRGVTSHQLPGVKIVAADTTIAGKGVGTISNVANGILAESEAGEATFIATHHQLQHHRVHYYWPPGIPTEESAEFLNTLATRAPNAFTTSGHTHRNRARRHKGLTITEVASTRDWPGVWAGYTVYEGGVTQTVRRATAPTALRWHEYGRQAVGGLWGLWSPGRLEDRCIRHNW